MEVTKIIQSYYDSSVEAEWGRIAGRPEFLLTCRFLERYLRPGDRVLDIGGGPGRYALHLAQRGCEVTLLDLSAENARFADAKAREMGLPLRTLVGDAREADAIAEGPFDHVLLMGPLYHLLGEGERAAAVGAALRLLRPGGLLCASFITLFSGMIYGMKFAPEIILSDVPAEAEYRDCVLGNRPYAGEAFTQAVFLPQGDILPFMARFPLDKLHLFSQEGILSPLEGGIMAQPPEVIAGWLDLAEALAEREELLGWAEHLMYIGRKRG